MYLIAYMAKSLLMKPQYKGGMFKIGFPNRWVVILTGPRLMEELARLPNDIMSNTQAHVTVCTFQYITHTSTT